MSREGTQPATLHSHSQRSARTPHDSHSTVRRRSVTHPTASSPRAPPNCDDSSRSQSRSRKRRRRAHTTRSSTSTAATSSTPSIKSTPRPATSRPPTRLTHSLSDSVSSDSDDFLLTAAERAQRRLQRIASNVAIDEQKDAPPAARPLPGYHFDRAAGKYFRITVGHEYGRERREERLRRTDERKKREEVEERKDGQLMRRTRRGSHATPTAALFPSAHFTPHSITAPAPLPPLLFQRSALPDRLASTRSAIHSSLLACLAPASLFSPISSLSSLPVSSECSLAFDPLSSSVSLCGAVVESQLEREDGEAGRISSLRASGSYHSVYALARRETQQEEREDEPERKEREEWRDAGLEARLVHRHETPSLITSSHILTVPFTSLTPSPAPSSNAARPRSSLFYPSPYIPPTSPSSSCFILETLLGSSSSPGSFKLLHCDGHVRSACILPRSSAFCSAPHPSFGVGDVRVVIGGGRGVCVYDCEGEQRRWLSAGNKSDQMSVMWRGTDEVYSGGRNGAIVLFDLRRSASDTFAIPSPTQQPGAVTLLQRLSPPSSPYVLLGGGGGLFLLDERRWGQSLHCPVVAEYVEQRTEYGCGRAAVTADGRHVMAADDRGSVRAWQALTGRCLKQLSVQPRSLLASVAGDVESVSGGGGGGVHHSVWLDDLQTLLVGGERGVSCYTIQL